MKKNISVKKKDMKHFPVNSFNFKLTNSKVEHKQNLKMAPDS